MKCDGTIVDTKKIEESIQSGETKKITFMVQIPEDFTAGKKVECQIINSAFGDADESMKCQAMVHLLYSESNHP